MKTNIGNNGLNLWNTTLLAVIWMLAAHNVSAATIYTDEASYLTAIGAYTQVSEGFEGAAWSGCTGETCTSVTNNGLSWTASDYVRIGTGWVRSGTYGVFDSFGDPDTLGTVNSITTLFGVGGWFQATTAPDINFLIDSMTVASMSLTREHQFLGIVDMTGFNSITFATSSGHWGADDFTFARVAVPEPATLTLLAFGLVGLGFRRRKA